MKDRIYYENEIIKKLESCKAEIKQQLESGNKIASFVVDDLLSKEDANELYRAFPDASMMKEKKTLREYKMIDAQMNKHNPLLEEITYAIQGDKIIEFISKITGIEELEADSNLYAGGLSRMEKGQYLNPHLDNSHDKDRQRYRVLNLLYYITPNRSIEDGGNLELWDDGPKGSQRTIYSKFNRLAVMITNKESWHSVSKVVNGNRCCISNYYFSKKPLTKDDYFHVTSFRGFPDEPIKNIILSADSKLRMGIRKVFKNGISKVTHLYEK